jgi:hypothetical protein
MIEKFRSEIEIFRVRNGLRVDDERKRIWWATFGRLVVPLPNFRWRREALAQHDMNHIITGYNLDARGELCVASWELGVGCYPNIWARSLCMSLFLLGIVCMPYTCWRAFQRGRKDKAVYALLLQSKLDSNG